MALVRRSNKKTNYILPVIIKKSNFHTYWYYDNEFYLFRAYNQLKNINIGIVPSYPIVYPI